MSFCHHIKNIFSPFILQHIYFFSFFFLNDPPTPEISPLPLHAPLPIPPSPSAFRRATSSAGPLLQRHPGPAHPQGSTPPRPGPLPPPRREGVDRWGCAGRRCL